MSEANTIQANESSIPMSDDFKFIAEASARLASSLDYGETLKNVAELMAERLCDYCMIYIANEDHSIRRVAATHRSSEGQRLLDDLMKLPLADPNNLIKTAIESGSSRVIPDVQSHPHTPINPAAERIRQQLNPTSFMVVPLSAGGSVIGAFICVRSELEPFTDADLPLVEELARRAATAIEHSRMYDRATRENEERKRAENRLQRLMASNLVAVCLNRFDGRIVEANDAFLKMIDRTRDELEAGQLDWQEITPEDHTDATNDALAQIKQTGTCGPFEKEYLRRDGTRFPVMLIAAKLENDEADALTVAVDMTDQKRSEDAQRYLSLASKTLSSSLDYQITLKNLADILVPKLADWCVIHLLEDGEPVRVAISHIDPEMVRWAAEVNERYPTDMSSDTGLAKVLKTGEPEFYPVIQPEMLEATARDEEHLKMIRQIEIGGAMVVPMIARNETLGALTLISGQQGRYTKNDLDLALELAHRAAIAVDHARLFRSVEEMVEERTEELQAVNRELESFAYSVSHDLRAPLRSIMSASMIVMEDYGDKLDDEGRGELKRSANAAKRMSSIIDDLLQYSRLGRREINPQEIDLSQISHAIGRELGIPAEVLDIEPDMKLHADADLIRVALTNLIENSWKFSQKGEHPKIQVGREEGNFYVKDNGVGFDEQFSEKLFVPFERLHSPQDYPGTGIGLANVKRIITRHGGKIWAHSKPGEGAQFYFTIGNAKG